MPDLLWTHSGDHGEKAVDASLRKKYQVLKRVVDVSVVIALSPLLAVVIPVVALAIKLTSPGPVLHWSERIGRGNKRFLMPKFRTMTVRAPQLSTDLLCHPHSYLTPIGKFLRRTSLDELPQLFSVLAGEISLVGPRPALFNQYELIKLRTTRQIDRLVPGITGWAQINGRDHLSTPAKVSFDEEYLRRRSLAFDMWILLLTVGKVVRAEGVAH
jgi:O-antigen biosynthesis protein WbqP